MKAEDIEMKQHRLMKAQEKEKHWKQRVQLLKKNISHTRSGLLTVEKKMTRLKKKYEELMSNLKTRRKEELEEVRARIGIVKKMAGELESTLKSVEGYLAAARDEVKQAKAVLR